MIAVRVPVSKLDEMRDDGFERGSRVEITVKKGAEYYDGYTPAPTTNPQGFDPAEGMVDAPDTKFTGYITGYGGNYVSIAFGWRGESADFNAERGSLYFHEETIFTYNK